jgi:hypothetical protein
MLLGEGKEDPKRVAVGSDRGVPANLTNDTALVTTPGLAPPRCLKET